MLLVTPAHVGAAAWHRLVRDAALIPLSEDSALPAGDVDLTATSGQALRAASLEWALPRRAVLTGLSALWVRGYVPGPVAWRVDVAVPRGCHPDPPAGSTMRSWEWHSDSAACAASTRMGPVPIAMSAHASVVALRRSNHALAIPAVAAAILDAGCTWDELEGAFKGHSRRGPGYERMASALAALRAAIPGPACERP